MRWGLYLALVVGVAVGWASFEQGLPPEAAATRGVIAFLALIVAVYIAGVVLVTAPPVEPAQETNQRGLLAPVEPAGESERSEADAERAPAGLAEARDATVTTDQRAA